MIDKHELRLLNWVKNKETGKFHRIIRLDEYSSPLDRIDPIELTEDILLHAGFEKIKDYFLSPHFNDGNEWLKIRKDEFSYYWSPAIACMPVRFQYLHKLMNFYYAYTGKELQIDLK